MKLFVLFGQDSRKVTIYDAHLIYYATFSSLAKAKWCMSNFFHRDEWVKEGNKLVYYGQKYNSPINYHIISDTIDK